MTVSPRPYVKRARVELEMTDGQRYAVTVERDQDGQQGANRHVELRLDSTLLNPPVDCWPLGYLRQEASRWDMTFTLRNVEAHVLEVLPPSQDPIPGVW